MKLPPNLPKEEPPVYYFVWESPSKFWIVGYKHHDEAEDVEETHEVTSKYNTIMNGMHNIVEKYCLYSIKKLTYRVV